jgi:hypothetical protein
MSAKRGIYVVANAKSQQHCANLVYSIRQSGCNLPICLIPFGGEPVTCSEILSQVTKVSLDTFPAEAHQLLALAETVLPSVKAKMFRRALGWFGEYDEFLYSDNDIVALMDWNRLFDYLANAEFVHADEEFTTEGRYNFHNVDAIKRQFGAEAIQRTFTAGHFLARRDPKMANDISRALMWMQANPGIAREHDQAAMNMAAFIGNWNTINLCQEPHSWLSSWSGDFFTPLQLVQAIQQDPPRKISHIHYSGYNPTGHKPLEEMLFSSMNQKRRLLKLMTACANELLGINRLKRALNSVKRRLSVWDR